MLPTIIILVVAVVLILFVVGMYNRLVALRNRYKNAYSQIDVQLKRRYDLIPNLVETAKAYLKHERETLESVIKARNSAASANAAVAKDPTNAGAVKELVGAENVLTATLGRLFALAENYPQLKADANMRQLSEELTSTENKVAFARQAYNDAVMQYNTAREVFPSNIIAGMFNFAAAVLFEIGKAEEREPVKVNF